jgi:Core-2/I-Branching enzyme
MPAKIGFAVLSHSEPEQLLRLMRTLTSMYDSPPIACHHDFGKCQLNTKPFPLNIKFVYPHCKTSWGHVSIPEAVLRALSLLRESDPDWYVLLSGCDYPVRPAAKVLEELQNSSFDAYIDNRLILPGYIPPGQIGQEAFSSPKYIAEALRRYYYPQVWLPHPHRPSLKGISAWERMRRIANPRYWEMIAVLKSPALARVVNKWNHTLPIYAGEMWFTVNRKAVGHLLKETSKKLLHRYRRRFAADESFFHTVLCNEPDLNICSDDKRYTDWSAGGIHPKWIEQSDFERISSANAHFARKFRADGRLLDSVDRMLLKRASRVA